MIYFTNTKTHSKEQFHTRKPHEVALYVCGITPYDDAHVGHGRCYVAFDVLYRFLKFMGYKVTYCRNFTDIDDRLIAKAQEAFGDPSKYGEIAQRYIDHYHEDMKALNCLSPDIEPRVTQHIPEIIEFIQGLIDKGHAYVVDGDVYFSIASFPAYGKLSKHKLEDLRAGARVKPNEKKKDPLDFALWKGEKAGTFWKSPWGYGRPGWHIECSALAAKYLGPQIDIHGGGLDLVFPHHENEVAQSESLFGKEFVNFWLHNGFVRINKEKMSKSLGNFFSLREVFTHFDPMVIRFYLLNHHYQAPLDFSYDDIKGFERSYRKLCRVFAYVPNKKLSDEEIEQSEIVQRMIKFLSDDLNTPGAIGVLFESLDVIEQDNNQASLVKAFIQRVLGLALKPIAEKQISITPEIQALIDEREKARAEKNWQRSDELRTILTELGVNVHDKKTGK